MTIRTPWGEPLALDCEAILPEVMAYWGYSIVLARSGACRRSRGAMHHAAARIAHGMLWWVSLQRQPKPIRIIIDLAACKCARGLDGIDRERLRKMSGPRFAECSIAFR